MKIKINKFKSLENLAFSIPCQISSQINAMKSAASK